MHTPNPATKTRVQRNGRDTSWDAATQQTPARTAPLYRAIYRHLSATPMTDEELRATIMAEAELVTTPSGVRSRRAELVDVGWVTEDRLESGAVRKRVLASGSKGIVWRAVAEGETAPTGSATPTAAEEAHAKGMAQARKRAAWELGDASWAPTIISAYLNPDADAAVLAEEMNDA